MADHFQGASVRVQPLSTRHPLDIPAGVAKERPSYTPVHTRLGMEVAKALGIDPAKVLKASLEFPEHGFTTMTLQLFVTEEQMRAALAAVAAIETGQQPSAPASGSSVYDPRTGFVSSPADVERNAFGEPTSARPSSSAALAGGESRCAAKPGGTA